MVDQHFGVRQEIFADDLLEEFVETVDLDGLASGLQLKRKGLSQYLDGIARLFEVDVADGA